MPARHGCFSLGNFLNLNQKNTVKTKQSRNLDIKVGATLIYNDGRAGHCGVTALVLAVGDSIMTVQFEDRADTTTIRLDDKGWMNFLTVKPIS